jgi:CRP-like cAMP-binding protein
VESAMTQRNCTLSRYLDKLSARAKMSPEAREAFLATPCEKENFETYRDLLREGEATTACWLMASGLVSRYMTLRNGGRQIVSFHIAGDMVDLSSCLMRIADHGIRAHAPVTVFKFGFADILRLAEDFPELGRAFWFDTLIDAAIFREWTLNVGRRSGRERVAHLLLEFAYRMKRAGLCDGVEFILPMTQADLADAVGMSPVHVNRSLQWLRANQLIRSQGKVMTIIDEPRLVTLANFNEIYLHPEGPRQVGDLH